MESLQDIITSLQRLRADGPGLDIAGEALWYSPFGRPVRTERDVIELSKSSLGVATGTFEIRKDEGSRFAYELIVRDSDPHGPANGRGGHVQQTFNIHQWKEELGGIRGSGTLNGAPVHLHFYRSQDMRQHDISELFYRMLENASESSFSG